MSLIYKGQTIAGAGGSGGGGGVPKGTIVIWSGSATAIPSGWALCDGQNGTPDLRDRFVVGAGTSYEVGATGGEAEHALIVAEMPTHAHSNPGYTLEKGSNTGLVLTKAGNSQGASASTTNVGNSQPHNNLPPYYALCYIMKITDGGSGTDSGDSSEEIYSTEEVRIGTWVDGKPLYRRVVSFTESDTVNVSSSGPYNRTIFSGSEKLNIIQLSGTYKQQSNSNVYLLPWYSMGYTGAVADPPSKYVWFYSYDSVNTGHTNLRLQGMANSVENTKKLFAGATFEIVLEYTKTTDEATS